MQCYLLPEYKSATADSGKGTSLDEPIYYNAVTSFVYEFIVNFMMLPRICKIPWSSHPPHAFLLFTMA